MDTSSYRNPLLDILDCPAFFVQDGVIQFVNRSAELMMFTPGQSVAQFLTDSLPVYQNFQDGCLYLTLQLQGSTKGATVTNADNMHLFCLDDNEQADRLLALTAQQLRVPLHSLFSVMEEMPNNESLKRSLFQLHRIVINMSDYPRYLDRQSVRKELTDLNDLFTETVEKASVLVEDAGVHLHYTALPQCIRGFANREMLERAIYNILSNAVKFSPKGSTLEAKLTGNGNMLYFSVADQGQGIAPNVLSSIFSRYLRSPGIEDSRHGIGLGMALVRAAATNHGGTILIDQPESGGTRVTITISVITSDHNNLRSPVMIPSSDYAGGRDHGLVELSDVLPLTSFKEN